MKRSYFIDPVLDESGFYGYRIFCFEDDDCVWDEYFATQGDAEVFGEDYISGCFVDGFPGSVKV